jgi:glutathione S-transferase
MPVAVGDAGGRARGDLIQNRRCCRRRVQDPAPRALPAGAAGRPVMTIKLHKFGAAWGIADPSPFCLKVESFLREADIAYDVVPFDFKRSFAKAPKGKLPFIEDEDGTRVGDSSLIIERLSRQRGIDMDAPLDERQRGISLAFRRMLDEHLYWVAVYSRWLDEPGRSVLSRSFFAGVWRPIRPFMTALARRRVEAALRAQGMGRHSREEIYEFGREDLQALSGLLGADSYFFAADGPTLLDLSAHAFVAEIVAPPIDSPLKQACLAFPNLTCHFHRLQTRLYA